MHPMQMCDHHRDIEDALPDNAGSMKHLSPSIISKWNPNW
jgi:hypothetical protein